MMRAAGRYCAVADPLLAVGSSIVSLPVLMGVQVLVCWRSGGGARGAAVDQLCPWCYLAMSHCDWGNNRRSLLTWCWSAPCGMRSLDTGDMLWVAGCPGQALEDISNFSVLARGNAEVKNCWKACEGLHLCKTWTQSLRCCLTAIAVRYCSLFLALLVAGREGRVPTYLWGTLWRSVWGPASQAPLKGAGPFTPIAHRSPKVQRKLLICLVLVRLELVTTAQW